MAASNYDEALRLVLKAEGGYANNENDNGGETMYGITVAVARANGYTGPMRSIPMSVVKKIYREKYWDELRCDNHPAGLDYCIFDYGVNSGVGRARKVLAALAPKYANVGDLIVAICDERLAFLRRLSDWKHFGKGWTSRVSGVRKSALAMIGKAPAPVPPPPDVEPVPEKPRKPMPIPRPTLWTTISAFISTLVGQLSDWRIAAVVAAALLILIAGYMIVHRVRS